MARNRPICRTLLAALTWACASQAHATEGFQIVRRLPAVEARQGVAVDDKHVYAIGNRAIGKYDKQTGKHLAAWQERNGGRIIHLNSGIVVDGRLYCAHSNYPTVPMLSSIEIFDTSTLKHVDSRDFGTFEGSATWVDRHADSWWVAFANYTGKGGQPGRGPQATALLRFDPTWKVTARYSFPPPIVERFGTRSNSGGAWGANDLLYATGHDAAEVYVLRLPRDGSVLELVEIIPAAIEGQGIAWDPVSRDTLWGILKSARQVVALGRRSEADAEGTLRPPH